MSPDELDAAIDYLEDALSDLRWANRGGNKAYYVAKARNKMLQAEDKLDQFASKLIDAEPSIP